MAPTKQQKALCAVEYAKTSVITVQRNFRRHFEVDPPDKNSIKRWHTQLMETGCLCKGKSTGRPSHSEETVDRVRQSFLRSAMTSVRKASRELALPRSTFWDVLYKRLKFKAYKLTLVQALTENDKQFRIFFSVNKFLKKVQSFSDTLYNTVFCGKT
jgi:hypothetical protein